MRDWRLPAEPFRLRLERWLAPQERVYNAQHEMAVENAFNGGRPDWYRLSPRDYIAIHTGQSRSWVEKLLRGERQTIEFDTADRLMQAMNFTYEWVRSPMYQQVNLKHLDKVKPLQYRRHSGGARRKVNYSVIKALYEAGVSRSEIMEQTGCSVAQLDRVVKEYGLSGRQHPGKNGVPRSFDYAKAQRLHDAHGLTWVEVARELGVDVRNVYQAMQRVRDGKQELVVAA